jgi:Cu+-exporting ATPase
LTIAAGLEHSSEHPLAEAVMEAAAGQNIQPVVITDFQAVFGKGISGIINGQKYYAGNRKFLLEHNIVLVDVQKKIDEFADAGKTPLLFADAQKLIGIIAVADIEKASSKEAIGLFKQLGIAVVMLTGDNKRTAEAIRSRLGIPSVQAEVLPQDKSRVVAELQQQGHKVAMIGDGVNDAPALAQADLGIAIGAGTDVAIESADAVLVRNDLLDAVSAIQLSKAVIKNIKENLFWAFFYNSVGIPLAAGLLYPAFGWKLTPMFGAAAMSMSSFCVVANALRLRFFSPAGKNIKAKKIVETKEIKTMEKVLIIKGMMCQHCQKHVNDALSAMPGVKSVNVDLAAGKATVQMDKDITEAEFAKVIEKAGYELVK